MNSMTGGGTQSRQVFFEAFSRLLDEKNPEKITVRDLIEVSGYSRSTFYRLFSDLPDLIDQLEEELVRLFIRRLRPYIRLEEDESRDELFAAYRSLYHEHEPLLKFYTGETRRLHTVHTIIRLLPEAFGESFESLPDLLSMEIYLSGVFSALNDHLEHPGKYTEEELLAHFRRLFENYLLAERLTDL